MKYIIKFLIGLLPVSVVVGLIFIISNSENAKELIGLGLFIGVLIILCWLVGDMISYFWLNRKVK